MAGRVPLTGDVAGRLPAALTDGAVNNIDPSGPGWMFVLTWPAVRSAPATDEPLLVWAWAAGRDRYPGGVDQLRQALLDPGPGDLVARVGRYEQQMRGYANQALGLSTRNTRQAATTSRAARLAFRTLLRTAKAIPPVKRAVFGGSRAGAPPVAAGSGRPTAHTG